MSRIFNNKRNADDARKSAKRGGKAVQNLICIEGEYLTSRQIAARLGTHATTALDRLKRARKLPGPVTWARLGLEEAK